MKKTRCLGGLFHENVSVTGQAAAYTERVANINSTLLSAVRYLPTFRLVHHGNDCCFKSSDELENVSRTLSFMCVRHVGCISCLKGVILELFPGNRSSTIHSGIFF